MKKIYILSLVAVLLSSSCEKLDREIITEKSKDVIDKSWDETFTKLTSIYAELPSGFSNVGGGMMASATDEAEHTAVGSSVQKFNTGNWNAYDNPDEAWEKYYRGIRRANQFLASVNKVDLDRWRLDPAQATTYASKLADLKRWPFEVRFLRAYFYFELVKRYGGVPIFETEESAESFAIVKRNTFAECIKFITDECDATAAELPVVYPIAADYGRITKGAALALKSRVLLYAASDLFNTATPYLSMSNSDDNKYICYTNYDVARWQAAANAAKAVIDLAGAGYALHAHAASNPSYKVVFQSFVSPEILLSRRLGSSFTFESDNLPVGFNGAKGLTTPSQNLVDAYEVKNSSTSSEPFDWAKPAHAANPYANRDPRLALSIITNDSRIKPFASPFTSPEKRLVETFPGGLDARPLPNATKTGYYIRKYINEGALNLVNNTPVISGNTVHNWVLIRLPEIYLNYAEALNEYNPTSTDIATYVNRVRTRPGVDMPALVTTGLSQAQVREKIRHERRIELAFEDHRAWDLRRWKQGETYLGAPLRGVEIEKTATSTKYTPVTVETRVFTPRMYLYPIPQSDVNISRLIVQNPGW
jgi:starch-binding outer membrane protein, SusD/RagB family